MTTAPAHDRDRVGPYLLIKAIGAGGSARIDLARIDRAYNFQRHVVIKRPLEHLRGDAKASASLRREARIGGLLRHPNLVAVLDAGVHETEAYDYLVLEYVHGASLRTLMQADGPGQVRDVALGVALALVVDIARGLHHAHELADEHGASLGLVHRDVSPGNVLVGLDGTVKLADFGIAKETRVTTLSGSMHGTVTYMAPEQCRGHAFDRRADVWALGVILHELVTGARLFWADNDVASLHRVLSGNVPRPRKVKPAITAALDEIVMGSLAQDPAKRYGSAAELADALERYAADTGEMLTARAIAGWAEDVIGPRDVPWLGSATIPDIPRADDRSLVDIIVATTGDDDPPLDTFGPSEAAATMPDPPPPARRTRWPVAAIVASGLVGGAAIAWFATREPDAVLAPAVKPAPVEPAPVEPAPVEPALAPAPTPPSEPDPDPVSPVVQPVPAPPPAPPPAVDRRRGRPRPVTVKAEPPPPPPVVETGSGSATKPRPKWDPGMLLPSDGSGKRR